MKTKAKLIAVIAAVALLAAGGAGAAVWWMQSHRAHPAGDPKAEAPKEEVKPAPDYKYVTLDKVLVMLRGPNGSAVSHYMAVDIVFKTLPEQEKRTKEHLPLLRTVAVKALSVHTVESATAMSVEDFALLLNKAYQANYAAEHREPPFAEALIGKLIIEYGDATMQHAYAEWGAVAHAGLSAEIEQRALREYAPLVKRVVRQLSAQASAVMDREDMEQIGLMGLLEALRRYGTPDAGFGSFAALRVRGAILDELRRQDWRPRTVRQDSHKQRDALRALTRALGREPTEAEILQHLQLSPQAYQAFLQAEVAEELASFDELVEDLAQLPSEQRSPEAQLMVTRSIAQALSALNEREQKVIQLYYEFDASLKEIAAVLDLTEARVSQINKGALAKMRAHLQRG